MIGYIAADKNGSKWFYDFEKPERGEDTWSGRLISTIDVDEIDHEAINNLTWDDEPIKVTIITMIVENYRILKE